MSTPDQGLRRALEVAGVPLAVLDHEGLIESVNAQFAALFSATAESLIGHHLITLCDTAMSGPVTSALVRIIGGVSNVEMVTIHPDDARSVTFTLTPSHHDDGTDPAIFCVASPTGGRPSHGGPTASEQPDADDSDETGDDDVLARIASSITRSERQGKPFALLIADLHDDSGDPVDDDTNRIVVSRILQRLRASDSVIHHQPGTVFFLAEQLGTIQDAVGVAYRVLSTTIDPIRTSTDSNDVSMTIGIAVGDGDSSPDQILAAGRDALTDAMSDGSGGFRTVDTRSGVTDPDGNS